MSWGANISIQGVYLLPCLSLLGKFLPLGSKAIYLNLFPIFSFISIPFWGKLHSSIKNSGPPHLLLTLSMLYCSPVCLPTCS